ncbi:branched chain amino acid ABC transporter inner membrane protein [Caballeronia temeraria]|uniref:Branched chain amino acid ABC transporter inner membrane protein n=1 Tax=Caballeronia temeraria TaxID=1777137 RepID=A0A158DJV9_9BURK|nr:branched-chain amino acid ABC transporter permease [Caballeronia temeraria]SAK94486.1 branched chain amino acid ABC transporter inner membrane protein [Caballeronia temeraria]
METALQLIFTALQIGAVYVLFSLGLTLIFGVMRIVNFAHGHFFTISALVVSYLVPIVMARGVSVQVAYLVSAAGGLVVSLALAVIVYKFGLRFFLRDMDGAFILTMGMALLLDGIVLSTFGGAVRAVPEIISGTVSIFGVAVTLQRLVLCLAAVVITAALYWSMSGTRIGKALRAVASDHEAAMLQGVPYSRLAMSGFMIAAALAAVAGALIAPVSVVSPVMGSDYLMKGFISVVLGGLGSVPGAIVGALFIGLVESVGGFYFDSSSASVAIFVLVIVVLLVRPKGLLGNA